MPNNHLIDRRTCLKGLGVALALPLLETMGWADQRKGQSKKPPVRLGFMYMPHGVIMNQFWPTDPENFLTSPPKALESLAPVMDQCLMVKGINGVPINPLNGAPHALELSDLAHRDFARRRKTVHRPHRRLGRSDRGELCRRLYRAAVPGIGDDAADPQRESGRAERSLLLALQLPFTDPADAGRDRSSGRLQAPLSDPESNAGRTAPQPPRTKPRLSIEACSISCSAGPRISVAV